MRAVLVSFILLSSSLPSLAANAPGCKITLEQFNSIKLRNVPGHAYNKLGCRGTVVSENNFGSGSTRMEQWEGEEPNSIAHVTFSNGWIISKSQFGLK
jgi:hypothetical protein